ncbi:hypothetical protein HY500_03725 [Candidatus Woesearchaeota archaeon]|nr:hypothetical protein [Candidatus Woesearchaeota archaeon]
MKLNFLEDAIKEVDTKLRVLNEKADTVIYREEKIEVPKEVEVVKETKTVRRTMKKTPKPKVAKKAKKGNIKKMLKRF